jgi:hypothetical protein
MMVQQAMVAGPMMWWEKTKKLEEKNGKHKENKMKKKWLQQ